jgi:hypothetical protein
VPSDPKLETLKRQLAGQGFNPLSQLFGRGVAILMTATRKFAASLQNAAYGQPLTTLLLACQAGYLVARPRRRHAGR